MISVELSGMLRFRAHAQDRPAFAWLSTGKEVAHATFANRAHGSIKNGHVTSAIGIEKSRLSSWSRSPPDGPNHVEESFTPTRRFTKLSKRSPACAAKWISAPTTRPPGTPDRPGQDPGRDKDPAGAAWRRGARSEERGHAARARFPGRNRREWVRLLDLAADVPACAAKERRTLTSPSTRDYHADAWLAATVRSRRPERRRAGSRELELRSGPALGGRPWTIGLPRDDQSVQSTRHPFDKLNVAGVQKSALFRYQA